MSRQEQMAMEAAQNGVFGMHADNFWHTVLQNSSELSGAGEELPAVRLVSAHP